MMLSVPRRLIESARQSSSLAWPIGRDLPRAWTAPLLASNPDHWRIHMNEEVHGAELVSWFVFALSPEREL
jgi:hypothetical protein